MSIVFNPETMSTGYADIDEQHKELFNRLNQLLDAMKSGRGRQEVEKMVAFLGEYAVRHFAHEERCMDRMVCPMTAKNKAAHAQFLETFTALSERIAREGPSISAVIEVQTKVSDWVLNHIVRVDTHMKACVKKTQAAHV